jgi:hypothetical protein
MRTHVIVVLPPLFNQDKALSQRPEPVGVKTLVSELPVEAFTFAIFPGAAGSNEYGLCALASKPFV